MGKKIRHILKSIFTRWNEYLPFAIALPAWWFSSYLTRLIDPTAGVDDAGLFQALTFGLVLYFAACAFSFMAMRIVFPVIGKFIDDYLGSVFITKIPNETKTYVALILFAVYFFGAIIIFSSVI
jgi:hypothetical protein